MGIQVPSVARDSVLSFFKESEVADAVTRAERWPISAPPSPMASAIDSSVGVEAAAADVAAVAGCSPVRAGADVAGADTVGAEAEG
ncbi:hypothetical protein [Pseudarthrobacter sp. NBSH8]|uniref:hypothetical protein n=1 Tax=Pseudarthrobacter sp. NBSH8 TaxID=2596911 RepID=UPI001625C70A|nr:hypothetical protein [Pseudarthrobacter sp. NBSH8]QNE15154.1 hypothetical protein FYJ92_12515 [Pseudarthrobacter sp. NBSH8]